jgi:hypothetical protein
LAARLRHSMMSYYTKFDTDTVQYQTPEAVPATSSGRQACQAQWNRLRQHIKRLYVDEGKTLKDVMSIMAEEHGHQASYVIPIRNHSAC